MGQYWKVVNLDKKEFLHPHKMDDGLKFLEQSSSGSRTLAGLMYLLAPLPHRRGFGDPTTINPLFMGRWAGDRIVYVGDYSVDEDAPHIEGFGALYEELDENYRDISKEVAAMVASNP